MQAVTAIGPDMAKVGQVLGIVAQGKARAFFQRLSPCLVGIDACARLLGTNRPMSCSAISSLREECHA
jgi:hypothetical protein